MISHANLDELTDWNMHLWRGERFCDSHIAQATEMGCTLAITKRTIELAEEWLTHHPRPGRLEDDSEYTWHQF
ncbi:DUF6508 domain-containing protein [Corynebacterium belfantii]|uniref:DUF6508 domain-containing protein n=2 Tax=Corynebacterium belfantii TaxID=2014537 RepID=UPI00353146AA